jgi:hypothetical protein
MPKPRWRPLPELLYAQVVKSYRRRRLVGVTHRVVWCSAPGWPSSRSWRDAAGPSTRPLWRCDPLVEKKLRLLGRPRVKDEPFNLVT